MPKIQKPCTQCGSIITRHPSHFGKKNAFCDSVCRDRWRGEQAAMNGVDVECAHCGKVSRRSPSRATTSLAFCSNKCQGLHMRREKSTAWKGGRLVDSSGYVILRMPGSPLADVRGYVREHVLVATQEFGHIAADEVVHHINGNKTDNRPENLQVMTRAAHIEHHRDEIAMKPRKTTCGHDEPHAAHGLCKRCYNRAWKTKRRGQAA